MLCCHHHVLSIPSALVQTLTINHTNVSKLVL
uniref:Uncharacterized protein n=1 Tax=Arundo donax TaxID=35708 RepID=A0A0A8ZCT5_ARUDO